MRRPKVLIIDDDHDHLLICRLVFEKNNCDVKVLDKCHSEDHLWETLSDSKPDIIYVDQDMPGLLGSEIITTLKSNPETASIPILYFSGHPALQRLTLQYGADGYICKPFDINDLIKSAAKHISLA